MGGYLTTRIGQPSVLGELLVGLILGPSLIDIAHLPFISNTHIVDSIAEIGELGVLFLMFLAGLELQISDLAKNLRVSALAGSFGVVVPIFFGSIFGLNAGMDLNTSVFLGLTLAATSVSISAQTLMELHVLRSKVGLGLLGAAVFDDVLVILFLSIFIGVYNGGGSVLDIIMIIVQMCVFLALSVFIGIWLLPRLIERFSRLPISQNVLTLSIVIMLFYGIGAELLGGMAAITGAFIAGLMFARTPQKTQLESGLSALAFAFFVPIFFVNIGLSIDLSKLSINFLWISLMISLVAIIGKLLGAGLGARLGGYKWRESLQLGIGMISRGEVGLIVANVGMNNGLIGNELFSSIIGMVLVTTLVTPPLLRAVFPRRSKPAAKNKPQETIQKETA